MNRREKNDYYYYVVMYIAKQINAQHIYWWLFILSVKDSFDDMSKLKLRSKQDRQNIHFWKSIRFCLSAYLGCFNMQKKKKIIIF